MVLISKKEKIRVLHITFDMGIGGTEQVIRNLVTGDKWPECGVQHHLCCIESPLGTWGCELQRSGVPVDVFQRKPKLDWSLVCQIHRIIQRRRIHIVHAHQYTPFTYGFLASRLTPAKVIFTEHGRFYPDSSTLKRRTVNRLMFPFVNKITAISEATKQALVDHEAIPSSRIDVIYNGIHTLPASPIEEQAQLRTELGIPQNALIFGTIARFDPIKNQTLMIRGFAEALKKYPHLRLVLVGDGPERTTLNELVAHLGITDQVIFVGYQPHPHRYVHLFDVFLLTSLSEGTSMTLLEAMSAGKPCIVSAAGGNPEIVSHNKTGLVFPNNDQAAYVAALHRLIENENDRLTMSAEAISVFDTHFTAKVMQHRFLDIYQTLSNT
jgi:glycosyltransferase involved in cell wall biosynthesis